MTEPTNAASPEFLAADGRRVFVRTTELVEDCDGAPLGVETTTGDGATLYLPPEFFGTQAELDDEDATE